MSQLVLAIAVLTFSIFVHEMGHFLVARWRGLHVPRFSIFGLGKPIVSRKWRGVEWCICWLPIGAYVMIPQLSDLGDFEGELPPDTPKLPPAGYLSKVLVAVAGPIANILLALVLGCVVWIAGIRVPVEYTRTEIGEMPKELIGRDNKPVPSPALAAGLQFGDKIVKIDDEPVEDFDDVMMGIVFGSDRTADGRRVAQITVERNGVLVTKQVYPVLAGNEGLRSIGVSPRADLMVEKLLPDLPAAKSGLQTGDLITAVDGIPLGNAGQLKAYFQTKHDLPSTLEYKRNGTTGTVSLIPQMETNAKGEVVLYNKGHPSTPDGVPNYRVGIQWKLELIEVHQTPLEQIGRTIRQSYFTIFSLLNRKSDIGFQHVSGPVGMADNLQQAASAGLVPMFALLLMINMSLAIFNLLPIPVLDGGHILFATITKIRRRAPSPAVMHGTVTACFFLLVGMIFYVTYHDSIRAWQRAETPTIAPAKAGEVKKKAEDKSTAPAQPK